MINENYRSSLLCEYKWDKMTNMHCLRGRPSACIKVKGLLIFVSMKDLVHISEEEKTKENMTQFKEFKKKYLLQFFSIQNSSAFKAKCINK